MRTNSMVKGPVLVAHSEALTVNTPVYFRWKFTTSEWRDAVDDRVGLHVSWLIAGIAPVAPVRAHTRMADNLFGISKLLADLRPRFAPGVSASRTTGNRRVRRHHAPSRCHSEG